MKIIKMRFLKGLNTAFLFLVLVQSIALYSCSDSPSVVYKNDKQEQVYQKVTFNNLINTPKNYAYKTIELIGQYEYSFEVSALYSDRWKLSREERNKALWIRFDFGYPLFKEDTNFNLVKSYQEFEKINGKRIRVRGEFYPNSKGHLSQYWGTIGNIVYLEVLN